MKKQTDNYRDQDGCQNCAHVVSIYTEFTSEAYPALFCAKGHDRESINEDIEEEMRDFDDLSDLLDGVNHGGKCDCYQKE